MVESFPTLGRNLLSCRCARPDHPLVTGVCAHSPVQLSRSFMAPLSRYSLVRQVETAGAAAAAGHCWSPASPRPASPWRPAWLQPASLWLPALSLQLG